MTKTLYDYLFIACLSNINVYSLLLFLSLRNLVTITNSNLDWSIAGPNNFYTNIHSAKKTNSKLINM